MTECTVSKVRLSCFRSKAFREFLIKADDALWEKEQKELEPKLNIKGVEIYDDRIRFEGKDYFPKP